MAPNPLRMSLTQTINQMMKLKNCRSLSSQGRNLAGKNTKTTMSAVATKKTTLPASQLSTPSAKRTRWTHTRAQPPLSSTLSASMTTIKADNNIITGRELVAAAGALKRAANARKEGRNADAKVEASACAATKRESANVKLIDFV